MLLALDHGHAIAFDRYGEAAAPPVVLLHGLSGSRTTYDAVVEHVAAGPVARGAVQLVNVDLRGHGESSHVDLDHYDAAGYAADVVGLLEHIDAGHALLVGHSLGGVVAAAVAATRPDLIARLVLEDPPLFEGDHARRAASPVASFFPLFVAAVRERQQRQAPLDEYAELLRATTAPELLHARSLEISRWDPATMEAAVQGIVWREFDPLAVLACPITVLRADPELGAVFSPDDEGALLAANPQADIVMIEGAAHAIHDPSTLPSYLHHLDVAITAFTARDR